MRKLVSAITEKEVLNLLIEDIWPDNYEDVELYKTFDKILKEYSDLKNDNSYSQAIKNKSFEVNDKNRIKFYYGLLYLFTLSPVDAQNVVKCSEIKQDSKDKVKKKLDQLIFDEELEKLKKESKKDTVTFEDMCIGIETYFNITLDLNITVKKFVAYENRIKKIEEKKKWLKNSKT